MTEQIRTALRLWEDTDLRSVQNQLDADGLVILRHQKETKENRRLLAEQTRKLRSKTSEEEYEGMWGIFKAYQREIDSLTSRLEYAENAFLSVYPIFMEAPDPAAVLRKALQVIEEQRRVGDDRHQKLNAHIAELTNRIAELEALQGREVSLAALDSPDRTNRVLLLEQREQELEWQLQRANERINFSTSRPLEDMRKTVERPFHELEAMEAELMRYREMCAQLQAAVDRGPADADTLVEYERKCSALAYELDDLQVDRDRLRGVKQELELSLAEYKTRESELCEQHQRATEVWKAKVHKLEMVLQDQSDYDVMKEEWKILRALEDPTNPQESLEIVSLRKNRRLESEMAELRIKIGDVTSLLAETENKLTVALHDKTQLSQANHQLERELAVAQLSATDRTEPTNSLVPILVNQRDRLQKRNLELEDSGKCLLAQLNEMRSELSRLKEENIVLFEKIRYLQAFQNREIKPHAAVDIHQSMANRKTAGTMLKYNSLYEEKYDPIREFHKKEELRRVQNLSTADLISLQISKMLMLNRYTRAFLLLYVVVLHVLVFGILAQFARFQGCAHENSVEATKNAMKLATEMLGETDIS